MTTNLLDASAQLAHRPTDEHFADFATYLRAAQRDKTNSREIELDSTSLQVVAEGDKLLLGRGTGAYGLTSYSFGRLAQIIGAPRGFLSDRLSPAVAAAAINDALQRTEKVSLKLLIGSTTDADLNGTDLKIRAITSPTYCRVWDADLLREVHEWLLPVGFKPALPTINTDSQQNNIHGNNKPALFRGDRDSFAFYMTDKVSEGHGDRPVRRGFLHTNSEVGHRAIKTSRFVFDDVCANFIIWGAQHVVSKKIIHRGGSSADAQLLRRFRTELRQCTPELVSTELEILRNAAVVAFAPTVEKAAERLTKQFNLTQAFAKQALEAARLEENRGLSELTHAWVANGVTSAAKATGNADSLFELATVGGDIFIAAGAL